MLGFMVDFFSRGKTIARLVVVNWTFLVSIWLRTGDGRLPMPVPHLGTLYLTVSRTLIVLCKHSNAISIPSFFPHTSTFSAFEVTYALYKSSVIITKSVIHGRWHAVTLLAAELMLLATSIYRLGESDIRLRTMCHCRSGARPGVEPATR